MGKNILQRVANRPLYPFEGHKEGAHMSEGRVNPRMRPQLITGLYVDIGGVPRWSTSPSYQNFQPDWGLNQGFSVSAQSPAD